MNKSTFLVLSALIAISLLLTGCGKKGKELARVNDEIITLEEFNERIERLPQHYRDIIKGQKEKFLDDIIMENLLYKEALKSGVSKDAEVQEFLAEARKKIIVASLIKKRVEDKVSVTEEEITKYYDEHSEEFMLPERWRASHILVDTADEAKHIKKMLDEGALFDKLAREKSKDATSLRGGDVGYFSKGQFLPEFENEVFKLKVGGISDVVKTRFGYHIITLTDRKDPEVQDLSSVKGLIKKELEREQKKMLLEELVNDLKNNASITINKELLKEEREAEVKAEEKN